MENRETLLLELLDSDNSALREIYLASFTVDHLSPALLTRVVAIAREDNDDGVRIAAAKLLTGFWHHEEVQRLFAELLRRDENEATSSLVRAMESIDDPRATDLLCQTYHQSRQYRIKAAILLTLDRRQLQDVRGFLTVVALRDPDEYLRAMTVTLLSRKEDPSVCPALEGMLHDPDARVRANAVEALGRFCDRYSQRFFLRMLHDSNHRVQIASLKVLVRIGWEGIADHLTAMAHSESDLFRNSALYFAADLKRAGA